ncbi:MAG: hypothetical protein JWR05_1364 [Mucilaginibacter sp.]|nr:hypothetical protein [Mucilaginibacter sp.]
MLNIYQSVYFRCCKLLYVIDEKELANILAYHILGKCDIFLCIYST